MASLHLLPCCLLRAPLLRVRDRDLLAHPLGRAALALASPDLSAALARGAPARRALARYGRRAAFRPTPHGLLAGVAVVRLGARTAIHTGEPEARVGPSWRALARRGRELLDDPDFRETARLRRTPSLLLAGEAALWLREGRALRAEVDERLQAVLEAAARWTAWPALRQVAGGGEDVDEYLLVLVDDGLLLHDLEPPLVGVEPLAWMRRRLGLDGGELAALEPQAGLLLHRPRGAATVARKPVERAAALASVLFRLQDALAPPRQERALDPALSEALDAVTETFGPGAFPLAPLALGDYGTALSTGQDPPSLEAGTIPAPLLRALCGASRERIPTIAMSSAELDAALPPGEVPPTFEVFLTPRRGLEGWLLGVHAPAGATAGRFAAALPELHATLLELARHEGDPVVDVAWAPDAALADLCTHPAVRRRALALTSWPEGEAIALGELALVADPRAADPLVLEDGEGRAITPSPLHRVRSTMLAPGAHRLVAGWSLSRQHAPWAMPLGPLAALPFVPRVSVDGFVISPATWRLPALANRRALAAFRRGAGLPRHLQVGHEDELLLVDLDDPGALDDLRGQDRVWEVWPPLEETVDRAGRRVEIVAFAAGEVRHAERAVGRVPAPRELGPPVGWRTFKLFGAAERQDRVLAGVVAPVVEAARRAGETFEWSFLRYVDGPGRRDHLRLRVHGDLARFEARLLDALEPARAAGDVITVETAEYVRELGRYGAAVIVVEKVAQSDSELVLALLDAAPDPEGDEGDADAADLLARAHETTCAALGLDREARRQLAARRRRAHVGDLDEAEAAAEFRRRHPRLRALFSGAREDAASPAFAAHAARLAAQQVPAALLPELLHLASVRLAGPDPALEALSYVLWERTLEGLSRSGRAR